MYTGKRSYEIENHANLSRNTEVLWGHLLRRRCIGITFLGMIYRYVKLRFFAFPPHVLQNAYAAMAVAATLCSPIEIFEIVFRSGEIGKALRSFPVRLSK
jgi:hypothetical protein